MEVPKRAGAGLCMASRRPSQLCHFDVLLTFLIDNSRMDAAVSPALELTHSLLVSLQRAGWATRVLAMAYSAWRSPKSIYGAWTTKAACSAVHCQALGCAGRSLKMRSSRWRSPLQVGLPAPAPQLPRSPDPQIPDADGLAHKFRLTFPSRPEGCFLQRLRIASFDIS